ncbi:hypothetical protein [Microbacterium sp.]|uniref:hypothetical protein n=1 Tax=Microbacterium sp. TaxID=51671 RepID=UPI0032421A84
MPDDVISLTLDGTPDLPSAILQTLYRLTGRLEKTIAYLDELGLPFALHAQFDGERDDIDRATLRSILEGDGGTL